jgi:hypothetical protein
MELVPEVLPSVWSLIRRALVQEPGIKAAALVERLTPRGLIQRVDAGSSTDASRHVRPSLNALIELGIVVDEGGLSLVAGGESESEFRRLVTRRVFNIRSNDDAEIWRHRSELQPEHHAELALSWLHLQGVESPLVGFGAAETRLQEQFGLDRTVLRQSVPYYAFERLAIWCGVAAQTSGRGDGGLAPGLIADPVQAVRAELDHLLPHGTDEAARSVVDRAAEIFTWLPTGAIGRAVATRMTTVGDDAASRSTVPEGLSLALIQLHHEGLIALVSGDDASDRVTLTPGGFIGSGGNEVNAVARIRRVAAASG